MEKPKSKRPLAVFICVAAVALVAAGVLVGVFLAGRGAGAEPEPEPLVEYTPARETNPSGRGVVITEDNVDEFRQRNQDSARFAHYRVRMTNEWEFDTATSPSRGMRVENSEDNPGTVFFDLILAETGELLYSSPYIPLGAVLNSISLDMELSPGQHDATVVYHLVDEYYEVQSTLSVGVILRILG